MSHRAQTHPQDPNQDCDPGDSDEDLRVLPLFAKLKQDLRPFHVTEEVILQLTFLLVCARSELLVQHALSPSTGPESHAEQIKACEALAHSAKLLSDRFEYFKQLLPLDQRLFAAFVSENQTSQDFAQLSHRDARREWTDFRERLHVDTALVAKIAANAHAVLKSTRAKTGRPVEAERDQRFRDLVRNFVEGNHRSKAKRIELAWTAWTTCFYDMETANAKAARTVPEATRAATISAVGKAMKIEDLPTALDIVQGRKSTKKSRA